MNTARKLSKAEREKNKVEKALKREELRAKTTPSEALMLYEKGMLSADSVLEKFGYDPDQEIQRKRYDAIQMQCLGLGLGQEENERTKVSTKATQVNILAAAIESARRTTEVLNKINTNNDEEMEKETLFYLEKIKELTKVMCDLCIPCIKGQVLT